MTDRSARMAQIQSMLQDDPHDAFLRYALAMEHAGLGDDATAVKLLRELLQNEAYVPGFLQAGQALIRLGQNEDARQMLRDGIAAAQAQGDSHAAGEMQGFLDQLD